MESHTPLQAAAAAVTLPHREGLRLSGFALRTQPIAGVHDEPQAKFVLLDQGDIRVLWVVCDLLGFSAATDKSLRERIAGAVGTTADRVYVSCTHTHSAGASIKMRGQTSVVDPAWLEEICQIIVEGSRQLPSQLEEASFGFASGAVVGISFNRDVEGGHLDAELIVMALRSRTGNTIATLINYAMHPVALGPENLFVSAEFPGMLCDKVQKKAGGVALFVQGACGDIDPIKMRACRGRATFEEIEEDAEVLAEASLQLLDSVEEAEEVTLSTQSAEVSVPMDPPPSFGELQQERSRLEALTAPSQILWNSGVLEWVIEAQRKLALGGIPSKLEAHLSVLRIGSLKIVFLPFEPFTEIGLTIKRDAGSATMIAAYSNGLWGYLPTAESKARGSYGGHQAHRFFPGTLTPLAAEASDVVGQRVIELLQRQGL